MIKYLTLEQVLRLHDAAIEKFGGLKGIRDSNLLLSCIENPRQSLFGMELHPTIYDKAAAYLFHIVCNHPFNDGNKRTGAGSAYLFLRINKISIVFESTFENKQYENLVVAVARGKKTKEEVSYFLKHGKEDCFNERNHN
ncbi:MAG TPA: type II toxin-antitoxin system death-on-curing family toxin [Rhabdochlamydiaceae bacterium]|nr:type II toxin-antitoxin system death-on-curing family toxin [Rhabdochlamydiaceae bacterium]